MGKQNTASLLRESMPFSLNWLKAKTHLPEPLPSHWNQNCPGMANSRSNARTICHSCFQRTFGKVKCLTCSSCVFCYSIFSPFSIIFEIFKKKMVKHRGAWRAAVHGVAKSQTGLSDWTTGQSDCNAPCSPHVAHSGQAAGWLGTQRCRASEETTMGAVGGPLLAWKGGCALSCLHIPSSGDPGKARPSLRRCALRQGSSRLSKPAHQHPFTNGSGIWFPNLPRIWISYSAMWGSKSLTPFDPTEFRRLSTSKGFYSDLPRDSPVCHPGKSQGSWPRALVNHFNSAFLSEMLAPEWAISKSGLLTSLTISITFLHFLASETSDFFKMTEVIHSNVWQNSLQIKKINK